jgi:hypothetical protein
MICAISQPTYLPWLGQFNLMDHADVFVFYDDVQMVKQTWDIRNKIKTRQGPIWLSVPISHNMHFDQMLFTNTLLDEKKNWRIKHLKSIQNAYAKAPFYKEIMEWLETKFNNSISILADWHIFLIKEISKEIGITTLFYRSSQLNSRHGIKEERLISICKELEATTYLSPLGAYTYIEKERPSGAFLNSQIQLCYQHYDHPTYPQLNGDFVSHMCILDLLFNVGFDHALEIIRSGRRHPLSSSEIRKKYMNE